MSEFSDETLKPEMAEQVLMPTNEGTAEPDKPADRQIVTEIVSAIKAEEKAIKKEEQTQRGLYFKKLASLHRFVRDLKNDETLKREMVGTTSIKMHGKKWELFAVKLAYHLAGVKLKKQTVSEHAQVLVGLREAQVGHETESVADWLGHEEPLEDGRTVSGRDKALLYAKRAKAALPSKSSAEAMKRTLGEKRAKKFAEIIEPKLAQSLGNFEVAADMPTLPEGFFSALLRRQGTHVEVVGVVASEKVEVEKAVIGAWAT